LVTSSAIAFVLAAAVSLSTSWLLVSRIERISHRFGLAEAVLGLIAALAADAPEITSATSAVIHRQQAIGSGVVFGSNVFNLAALLGVGALVAGRIAIHRRVVLLTGVVAMWNAVVCLFVVLGAISAVAGTVLVLAVMVPYVALSATRGRLPRQIPHAAAVSRTLAEAIREEESELETAIAPTSAVPRDFALGAVALVAVVVTSAVMERAGASLGGHFRVPEIVTGGLVLAAVTSVPNAVAGVYLARRRRGGATLSTTFNSNALNVTAGFLIPAAIIGVGSRSGHVTLVVAWYVAMSLGLAVAAFVRSGFNRVAGAAIVLSYLSFVLVLVVTT
jgi:cation:H+ antiporter